MFFRNDKCLILMKKLVIVLLLSLNVNAQIDSLTTQVLQQKTVLDTKVKLSKNYFKVSAAVLVGGVLLKSIKKDWAILGASGSLAATGTTVYYLVKHLVYVSQRNKFYKEHNLILSRKKKRKNKKTSN